MATINDFGNSFSGNYSQVFFGNFLFDDRALIKKYPCQNHLKQVHGKTIIEATPNRPMLEADGHFTDKKKLALVIQTADCMPVFFETNKRVFALHVGWRGLQQKILSEAVAALDKSEKLGQLWIGPHIHKRHFDFGKDLAETLIHNHKISWNEALKETIVTLSANRHEHFQINLSAILLREAKKLGFKDIYTSKTSTFTSPKHASHRRHPHQKKRNYSLIIRN